MLFFHSFDNSRCTWAVRNQLVVPVPSPSPTLRKDSYARISVTACIILIDSCTQNEMNIALSIRLLTHDGDNRCDITPGKPVLPASSKPANLLGISVVVSRLNLHVCGLHGIGVRVSCLQSSSVLTLK
jgi:hypothetical protein